MHYQGTTCEDLSGIVSNSCSIDVTAHLVLPVILRAKRALLSGSRKLIETG